MHRAPDGRQAAIAKRAQHIMKPESMRKGIEWPTWFVTLGFFHRQLGSGALPQAISTVSWPLCLRTGNFSVACTDIVCPPRQPRKRGFAGRAVKHSSEWRPGRRTGGSRCVNDDDATMRDLSMPSVSFPGKVCQITCLQLTEASHTWQAHARLLADVRRNRHSHDSVVEVGTEVGTIQATRCASGIEPAWVMVVAIDQLVGLSAQCQGKAQSHNACPSHGRGVGRYCLSGSGREGRACG